MRFMLPVPAMDYLISIKPLQQTKRLSENKPPVAWNHSVSQPWPATKSRMTHIECWNTHHLLSHMSRTLHNNLALNFGMSVCQPKHNAAVCTIFNKKNTQSQSPQSKAVYCRSPLTADIKLPTLTYSTWCCYLWGKSLVDNTVNNIKMTSVHQHWLPVQINKCPNWISALTWLLSPSFNMWSLKSWLSYCEGKNIYKIYRVIYEEEKSQIMKEECYSLMIS